MLSKLIFLFPFFALAETPIKQVDLKGHIAKPIEFKLSKPSSFSKRSIISSLKKKHLSIPPEKLILKTYQNNQLKNISAEDYIKTMARGGDDVGNGGDNLRNHLFKAIASVTKYLTDNFGDNYTSMRGYELALSKLRNNLSEQSLLVVQDLSINVDGVKESIQVNFSFSGTKLLIGKKYLEEIVNSDSDLRHIALLLAVQSLDINNKEELALELYSLLESNSKSAPTCKVEALNSKLHVSTATFSDNIPTETADINSAVVALCQEQGLESCEIVNQVQRESIISDPYYDLEILGYNLVKNSDYKCQELLKCQGLFLSSPFGQVSQENLNNLERRIEKSCQ